LIFFTSIQSAISFIQRTGNAGFDRSHARLIKPATSGPILSGRRRTGDHPKKIGKFFGAAKMKCGKEKLTPQDKVENNTPQRVQTTVSPPRVPNQNPDQTSLQNIISPHSTPNSHRRQRTPHRRIVTPQTPHGMVRRSSRQQNLTQDMMAETLSQVNHFFSISGSTEIHHPATPTLEGVILPEMANAVICHETGKSLKHQELITKLK
jgi:hypothetical protein